MQDVCLFAHFDQDGEVDEYVLWYLRKIKELQFSIVFISTARLSEEAVARLRVDCFDVILRDNTGFDFGSWSAGFDKHGSAIDGRLLLANDSVYGPIRDLATAFDRLTRQSADFYGFVENIEIAPHLQSWFLLLEPAVVRHAAFKAILAQPFSAMTKRQIIESGEVGLSRRLIDAGFRYQALYLTDHAGIAARRHPMNPMHVLWRELLYEEGVPFLKVELLRDNPFDLEDAATILQAVETLDPRVCALVKLHLMRTPVRRPANKPHRNPLYRWIMAGRHALLRNAYHARHRTPGLAELWSSIELEILTAALRAWQVLYVLRDSLCERVRPGRR